MAEDEVVSGSADLKTDQELLPFLQKYFYFERYGIVGDHSFRIGTTLEFDYEFAFFYAEALLAENKLKELGPYLSQTLVFLEDGSITTDRKVIRYSAYL